MTDRPAKNSTTQLEDAPLLSKDHTILERSYMEFQPFGADEHGAKIRDVSGVVLRGNVDYLQEYVTRNKGDRRPIAPYKSCAGC